jgi:hypothetical protein
VSGRAVLRAGLLKLGGGVLEEALSADPGYRGPRAPVTAYFLGVAVGRGEPLAETAAKFQQLARGWSTTH